MFTLAARIQSKVDNAQSKLTEWAAAMPGHADPHYQMGWSLGMFSVTADIKVGRQLLGLLTEGCSLDDIIQGLTADIMRTAKYPPQSTSPTSNLAEQTLAAARVEYLEMLQWALDRAKSLE